MLQGDSPKVPERFFNAFGQCLKRFEETDTGGLGVGVGQHKMIQHVRERFTGNRYPEILHVGKIGLGALSGRMALFKDHLLLRSMQCSPPGDMTSQRAVLRGTIVAWMLFTEQGKQRGGLQCRVTFELLHHPGPVFFKRVRTGHPGMRTLQFRWEFAHSLILARGSFTHPRSCSRNLLGTPFSSFRHIQLDLMIVFHIHTTCLFLRWCYARPLLNACREEWPKLPTAVGIIDRVSSRSATGCVRSCSDKWPG